MLFNFSSHLVWGIQTVISLFLICVYRFEIPDILVCKATLDKSVLIISSNLTLMNLRFRLLLVIRTLLSKVAWQTKIFDIIATCA